MRFKPRAGLALSVCALLVSGATLAWSVRGATGGRHIHQQAASASASGCSGCGANSQGTPVQAPLTEAEARLERLERQLEPIDLLEPKDAEYYYECAHRSNDIMLGRWALALAAERLVNNRFAPASRPTLESVVTDALESPDWRMRRAGINAAIRTELIERSEVAAKIRALRNDREPELAEHARIVVLPGEPPPTAAQPLPSDERRRGGP